tara:strand:- start:1680 stop:2681 length:1002 start_codon:yes stop_codon:yes gene_type:complete
MTTFKIASTDHVKELAKSLKEIVADIHFKYFNFTCSDVENRGKLNEYQTLVSKIFGVRHLHELNKNLSLDRDAKSSWHEYTKEEMTLLHSRLRLELLSFLANKVEQQMDLQCLSFALATSAIKSVGGYVAPQKKSLGIKALSKSANLSIEECRIVLNKKKLACNSEPIPKALQDGFIAVYLIEDNYSYEGGLILWVKWVEEKVGPVLLKDKDLIQRIGKSSSRPAIVNSLLTAIRILDSNISAIVNSEDEEDDMSETATLIYSCYGVKRAVRGFDLFGCTRESPYNWSQIFAPYFTLGKMDKKAKVRNLSVSIEKQIALLTKNNIRRTFNGRY